MNDGWARVECFTVQCRNRRKSGEYFCEACLKRSDDWAVADRTSNARMERVVAAEQEHEQTGRPFESCLRAHGLGSYGPGSDLW